MEGKSKISAFFLSLRFNRKTFVLGLTLLIINPPLGWIGAAAGAWLAWRRQNPRYLILCVILYGFSWLLLGLGILLAGPYGLCLARKKKRQLRLWFAKKPPVEP